MCSSGSSSSSRGPTSSRRRPTLPLQRKLRGWTCSLSAPICPTSLPETVAETGATAFRRLGRCLLGRRTREAKAETLSPPLGGVFAGEDAEITAAFGAVERMSLGALVARGHEPRVPLRRQNFNYKRPFDRRCHHMLSALEQGALHLDYDNMTEVLGSDDCRIAKRWKLLHARPAQPRVVPADVEGVVQHGPYRLHLAHGVPLKHLVGVSKLLP